MNLTKTTGGLSLTTKNTCKIDQLVGENTDQRHNKDDWGFITHYEEHL